MKYLLKKERKKSLIKDRIERFWSKVNKQGPYPSKQAIANYPEIAGTRCWEWLACKDRDGYGIFNKGVKAHRFAFATIRKLKFRKQVCHKCDNEGCVRPQHLFQGTTQQNTQDKVNKNRQARNRGELSGTAKLTNVQALKIRKLYASGKYTQRELGAMFNTSRGSVSDIVIMKSYRI